MNCDQLITVLWNCQLIFYNRLLTHHCTESLKSLRLRSQAYNLIDAQYLTLYFQWHCVKNEAGIKNKNSDWSKTTWKLFLHHQYTRSLTNSRGFFIPFTQMSPQEFKMYRFLKSTQYKKLAPNALRFTKVLKFEILQTT